MRAMIDNRTSVELAASEQAAIKLLITNGYEEAARYLVKALFHHINKTGRKIILDMIKDVNS